MLQAVPGVTEAKVTLEPSLATVAYDSGRTDVKALKAAIDGAGYDARA
ncbi:MAG: heavy-metal-associated domain-containing protein [Casimicrobiaceae bacterium]